MGRPETLTITRYFEDTCIVCGGRGGAFEWPGAPREWTQGWTGDATWVPCPACRATGTVDCEEEITLPSKYEVCDRCRGTGRHVNPSIDGHGITAEEMDENGPEFMEDYMSGVYDVTCEECDGNRVTLEADEEKMSAEQREAWEAHIQAAYEIARERASEERWGY